MEECTEIERLKTLEQDTAIVKSELEHIGKSIENLHTKVDDLNIISIINGNADGTPTMFHRNVFFQKLYNEINFLKEDKLKLAGFKESVVSLNWWLRNLFPIIIAAGMIFSLIMIMTGQQRLVTEIQEVMTKIK